MPPDLPLLALALPLLAQAQSFPLTPDSERQAGVPQGRVESSTFTSTKWYPGTVREMRVYVPAQYDRWLYVASPFGIQVLDQAGRVNGILANPTGEVSVQLAWSGSTLFVLTESGKVYARKMKAVGVQTQTAPVKPPAPRL